MIGRTNMSGDSESILWWTTGISGVAILAAPEFALWIQRMVDRNKSAERRKQEIFKALWVNRRRPFYLARVDALNMIDVEFYGEKTVQDAWQDLFAHYRDAHPGLSDAQIEQQREDKYATLLFEISKTLGYGFGKAHIRDNIHRPILHGTFESMEMETRQLILNLLKSDALPIKYVGSHETAGPANTAVPPAVPDEGPGSILGPPPQSV